MQSATIYLTRQSCDAIVQFMDMPRTLIEAIRFFADPNNCLHYMVERRWPTGEITCPNCGGGHLRFDRKRLVWTCNNKHPRRQFSVKVGTIFEDSPLGLDKWLPTVWMVANMKNGVSSHEIARSLGVTQKTAWFMLHRIRLAMHTDDGSMLQGRVEVDETYIGGKARNMHYGRRQVVVKANKGRQPFIGKTAVMGLLERHPDGGSRIKTTVLAHNRLKKAGMQALVRDRVAVGSEVETDALKSYVGLNEMYVHNVIDHAETYVEGHVQTNGVENFWSLLKRSIHGTYVNVMPFHLFRYLDEQAFRFNHRRRQDDGTRFNLVMNNLTGRRLTYQELIGEAKKAKN
jgi:transposase-like protein